ncbi:MAG TPA: hypothetical protein PKM41_13465 [Deltaproteobacteria bacterium]|jgi:hypothetical protein|nr:hypothetical protein [Deltaproteobacteria bacterium]HOI07555.1 hypothetical protein [Deltaproteobacteria bacterium]
MKIQDIRQIARRMGINVSAIRPKQDLIRDIQTAEGNSPCFRNIPDCGIMDCLWRGDCQSRKK